MNSKKTIISTLVMLAIVSSALALPAVAFADSGCGSAGTSGDDTIVCDTDTTGEVNAGDGDDEITVETDVTVTGNVAGGFGADEITVDEGATVDGSLQGNGDPTGRDCADEADTITNNGTVTGDIYGGRGNDVITNAGVVGTNIEDGGLVKGGDGDDTITNNGSANLLVGNYGNDTITNSGAVSYIDGNSGNDTITNSGSVDYIYGSGGNDTITNSGTVNYVYGNSGNDTITNSGNVTGNIEANRGNDTVVLNTGVQIGGTIYGSGCELGAADDIDKLIFNMSTYNQAEYDAAQTVIANATDETQVYSFAWDGGMISWQYFDTLIDKLALLFKSEPQPEPESKPESVATATLIFVEEGVMKVYQNDASGTLRFYGLGENSQVLIAELQAQQWENADSGTVLLNVESVELDTRLVVTALENGQLRVEYYSLADNTLLFSTVITP